MWSRHRRTPPPLLGILTLAAACEGRADGRAADAGEAATRAFALEWTVSGGAADEARCAAYGAGVVRIAAPSGVLDVPCDRGGVVVDGLPRAAVKLPIVMLSPDEAVPLAEVVQRVPAHDETLEWEMDFALYEPAGSALQVEWALDEERRCPEGASVTARASKGGQVLERAAPCERAVLRIDPLAPGAWGLVLTLRDAGGTILGPPQTGTVEVPLRSTFTLFVILPCPECE